MTDPKENEEVSEELSTDELKSVSGGFDGNVTMIAARGEDRLPPSPQGSGETLKDWKRRNSWEFPPIDQPSTETSTES
ncbi:hypothetical protein PMIT1320_00121 [Prochlorococcus marinus str. MIT 1320]|nr:hypothetical protein PMIT1320_00121 [Prochlorococcus marinus str. MIT 1320]